MNEAAKIISNAIIGGSFKTVIVNEKAYTVYPPKIYTMAGAFSCLAEMDLKDGTSLKDMLVAQKDCDKYAEALSWFIKGDNSLKDELKQGTYEEIVNGLSESFNLISPQVFQSAVNLTRNAAEMTAKAK
jgi:hypothetical protein